MVLPESSVGDARKCFPARGGYSNHMSRPKLFCPRSARDIFSHTKNKSVRRKMWPSL